MTQKQETDSCRTGLPPVNEDDRRSLQRGLQRFVRLRKREAANKNILVNEITRCIDALVWLDELLACRYPLTVTEKADAERRRT